MRTVRACNVCVRVRVLSSVLRVLCARPHLLEEHHQAVTALKTREPEVHLVVDLGLGAPLRRPSGAKYRGMAVCGRVWRGVSALCGVGWYGVIESDI